MKREEDCRTREEKDVSPCARGWVGVEWAVVRQLILLFKQKEAKKALVASGEYDWEACTADIFHQRSAAMLNK